MGGGSKSSSTTSTQQSDERTAATDNALAIGAGAEVDFNFVEPATLAKIVEAAESFANDGFGLANRALQFGDNILAREQQSDESNLAVQMAKILVPISIAYAVFGGKRN
jgi:hypothetical protein